MKYAVMLNAQYYPLVKKQYENSGGNSIQLFETILTIAKEYDLDEVLECLQQCVIEKRLAWWDRTGVTFTKSDNPLMDGFKLFYESYLGLSIPSDGGIVEASSTRLVSRWWNACPTLQACQELGLDTRVICRKVYQKPVEVLLSKIDPRLRFTRNYSSLRPCCPYCEEIISLGSPI
jgi:tRNA(adenine34) deaminase